MSASEERLYFLLQTAAQRVKKRADAQMSAAASLTTAQSAVLAIVIAEGGANHTLIANKLRQQKSAITTMANRLEKSGYIKKQRSTLDRRAWRLTATKAGLAAYQKMASPVERVNAVIDGVMNEQRVSTFAKELRLLIKAFED